MKVDLLLDGRPVSVQFEETESGWEARVGDHVFSVDSAGRAIVAGAHRFTVDATLPGVAVVDGAHTPYQIIALEGVAGLGDDAHGAHGPVHAPMNGKLDAVMVQEGASVEAGQVLFVLEAMKMRNEVKAAASGIVSAIHLEPGATVDPSMAIVTIAAPAD